jgi:hypothetical protein
MAIVATLNSLRIAATMAFAGGVAINPLTSTIAPSESVSYNSNGVGIGQTNVVYNWVYQIAPSGNVVIDLLNGGSANLDVFGGVLQPFARVKAIAFWFYNTVIGSVNYTASSVTIGAGTNPFIGPWAAAGFTMYTGSANADGVCDQYARGRNDATGWVPVTASSNNVKILNNDASNYAQLQVMFAGCNL